MAGDIYRRPSDDVHPPRDFPGYRGTALRHPKEPLVLIPQTLSEITGPVYGHRSVTDADRDLTNRGRGEPIGERIVVEGRVIDEDGRPVRDSLVELWQANAAGRYAHRVDQHAAPLDPNFTGAGRAITDAEGRYRFLTIKPGAYPWQNHAYAWRPQHIHFSLLGNAPVQRLVTQMYFPGDPLLAIDPVYNSVPDEAARRRMICAMALETGIEGVALGYTFDIVLGGARSTPLGI